MAPLVWSPTALQARSSGASDRIRVSPPYELAADVDRAINDDRRVIAGDGRSRGRKAGRRRRSALGATSAEEIAKGTGSTFYAGDLFLGPAVLRWCLYWASETLPLTAEVVGCVRPIGCDCCDWGAVRGRIKPCSRFCDY